MAETVLLIHGYGCAGDVWGPVAERLKAEGYYVVAPTIRSAVRTVDGPRQGLAGLTLADYVAEMSALAQTLTKETGKKPLIFGHSMGGLIAQKLAEAGHAAALVLFAPASPADARGKPKLSPVFTFLNMALQSKPETRAGKMWKTGFKFGVMNAVLFAGLLAGLQLTFRALRLRSEPTQPPRHSGRHHQGQGRDDQRGEAWSGNDREKFG